MERLRKPLPWPEEAQAERTESKLIKCLERLEMSRLRST
jgi:hypothetical protein